ncbi:MAG: ice-binding family protein [Desulfuromonadaceae bacterium]|nr:ice-binding family protein [Desulfuromonadaceae bacterium]
MNVCKGFSKMWFLVLLLVTFVAGCGGHDNVAQNSDKAFSAYSLDGSIGTIDETAKTIVVTMPNGTNVMAMAAIFTITGDGVKVGAEAQLSGVTANNFTAPVTYTVTAPDNTTTTYTVTVTVAPITAKAIASYSLAGVAGIVNETAKIIAVNVPSVTDLTALIATFTTTGTGVKVGTTLQVSGATANNFTAPVAYKVSAADNSTATYTVTVTKATAKGPAPVLLGAAGNYVILATSGVSTVPASAIIGDVGLSPAATSYLTGFSLTMVGTTAAISPQVTGSLYAADMTAPASTYLTTAVTNMGTAYTDAAGRPTPDFLNLGAGEIGGQTLVPGLYKWTTGVTISSNVTISGGLNDVWIFQIPQNLAMSPAKNVFLSGGAQAKNIFWQVAGTVGIGTTAHFEGIILSQTSITLETGASMNGRALAQTAVILDQSTVTKPE